MADEEKSKPLETSELQSLFIRAWNRAGVSARCELCSQDNWTIIHIEGLDGVAIPLRAAREVSVPGKLYLAYALEWLLRLSARIAETSEFLRRIR